LPRTADTEDKRVAGRGRVYGRERGEDEGVVEVEVEVEAGMKGDDGV
jgi:hypothetical protein